MKKKIRIYGIVAFTALLSAILLSSCFSMPEPRPTVMETVEWKELANQEMMKENDNRYVQVDVQFLGVDAKVLAMQMLYSHLATIVPMNHTEVGAPYDEEVISSTDSFLIGLPPGDETNALIENGTFGDTIRVTGYTKFVNSGFGTFPHLILEAETFENLGQ